MQKLFTKKEGGIAQLVFNRPEVYNALDIGILRELQQVFRQIASDEDVRVILLKSALEKSFVSGADIGYMDKNTLEGTKAFVDLGCNVFDEISSCSKPTIAAINGHCLGGGLELALACDIRIASSKARLGFPEVKLGILPGWGGLDRAPRTIGLPNAMELIFTGRMITAQEAKELGLVNRVLPPEEFDGAVMETANAIAANAPLAVALAKKWMMSEYSAKDAKNKTVYVHAMLDCFLSDDKKEGMHAFLEKRTPVFKGY